MLTDRLRSLLVAVIIAALPLPGCGGGGDGNSPAPAPGTQPPPSQPVNPCPTSMLVPDSVEDDSASTGGKRHGVYGDRGWTYLDGLWTHESNSQRIAAAEQSGERAVDVSAPLDADVGDIAVLQDSGDLVAPARIFDLRGRGLRFTPRVGSGYDVTTADSTFRSSLGSQVTLSDDDSMSFDVSFAFPFFGQGRTSAYVNSDGNITFGEGDSSSTARNVSRLLTGPPRISLFLSDLDPSAGGQVFVNSGPDAFTLTYCGVRGFESTRTVTAQATFLADGAIEMKFADAVNVQSAVVGLSPGRTTDFSPLDLSAAPHAVASGALGERFTPSIELDTVAVARRFFAAHPDSFDQLVIWTDRRVVIDAFAYETTVRNDIRGLGIDVFDVSRSYGGQGRFSSLVVMDWLGKYPDDPGQKFLGENDTVSVLGQETGHRWLVFFQFRSDAGRPSRQLLGRDQAHWSFFVDSDASVMEGNDIEDLGGGSFRTIGAVNRYSAVDQYAMGLLAEREVPSFFYVENPRNVSPATGGGSDAEPQIGVTFTGTRRDVSLADITAVVGSRRPTAAESPKTHRQAFIYLVGVGQSADPDHLAKLDRIRRAWDDFFGRATDGRGRVDSRLRP